MPVVQRTSFSRVKRTVPNRGFDQHKHSETNGAKERRTSKEDIGKGLGRVDRVALFDATIKRDNREVLPVFFSRWIDGCDF